MFQRAQSNFSKNGKPVDSMSQKRKSNQQLDNCLFRIILEREKEQLLAEAKSEILRHEYRADLAENKTCELKRQIGSQAVEIGHTRGYEQSRREQALLHEELADRERAICDSRVRSVQKLEELRSEQEFRLEFSIIKFAQNHFKAVESVRSGQLGKRFWKSTSFFFDNLLRNVQFLELISLLREIFRCKQARGDP